MEAGHKPPVAQAAPPQPVPVKPKSEGLFLQTLDVGCGFFLILIVAVVVFLGMVLFGAPSNWF